MAFAKIKRSLLGATVIQELSTSEVDELIAACSDADAIERLYEFGGSLLAALQDRNAAIESKATSLIGYSTAILAFLATRSSGSQPPTADRVFALLVAVFAAVACGWAFRTLRAAQNWKAFSERSWFPSERDAYGGRDALTRCYLQAMHSMLQENQRIVNRKAAWLVTAQLFGVIAGFSLAAWFGLRAVPSLWHLLAP